MSLLSHDKSTIDTYNSAIIEFLKKVTTITKVHYWSDGPSSQFKNRYNLASRLFHPDDFACDATWSFFKTAHGKGACDGVGAEVKRAVQRAILQGKNVINSTEEFHATAKRICRKVNVLYVLEEKVSEVGQTPRKMGKIQGHPTHSCSP